jgi:hypothetical protein
MREESHPMKSQKSHHQPRYSSARLVISHIFKNSIKNYSQIQVIKYSNEGRITSNEVTKSHHQPRHSSATLQKKIKKSQELCTEARRTRD